VNSTADSATATLKDVKDRLDGLVQRYNAVTERLADAMGHLRDILGDTKGDIRKTMANLSATTDTINAKLPKVLDEFDALVVRVSRELESTGGVLAQIRATASNAKDVAASANSLLASNRGKIDDIIRSLKTAGDNLKFATAEIRHSPWRLLYKPKANEMANLNLYDATRQFAEGATQLSDAATTLRDALADPQADKAKIEQLVERLDQSFGEFQKVESGLWNRVKQ
jgi:methyl-accepting chemotaxis protein